MRRIGLAVVRALSNVIGIREQVREIDQRPATTKVHRGGLVMNRRDYLKVVGALCAAVTFALYGSPGRAADAQPVTVLVTYHSATSNTEKMAQGVAEGAKAVAGTSVILKRVGEVAGSDLTSSDAVVVGSPVYFGNMSGEVKTFFDNWTFKFDLFRDRKMRNKVGAAFATGAAISAGKEFTILGIHAAMLINQMIVVSGGGGFGASATTGPDSPGIDEKELAAARDLGQRVAEVAALVKRGSSK
jgi:NAD(P)H dehydrogenase (quinone)